MLASLELTKLQKLLVMFFQQQASNAFDTIIYLAFSKRASWPVRYRTIRIGKAKNSLVDQQLLLTLPLGGMFSVIEQNSVTYAK